MFDLTGKTALVTGASNGIGKGIAICLARAGADVVVNYRSDAEGARDTVRAVKSNGCRALAVRADVSVEQEVDRLFEALDTRFGGLDILVNNAGLSRAEDIFAIEPDSWDSLLRVNLTSGYLCSRRAMERMGKRHWGRILFVSSVVAHQGALKGHAHYAASKAAQLGLAKTLARTGAGMGVTVNAIAPGIIGTELLTSIHGEAGVEAIASGIPLGLGAVEDVGWVAVFLSSEEAGYITGVTLDVNGGQCMR